MPPRPTSKAVPDASTTTPASADAESTSLPSAPKTLANRLRDAYAAAQEGMRMTESQFRMTDERSQACLRYVQVESAGLEHAMHQYKLWEGRRGKEEGSRLWRYHLSRLEGAVEAAAQRKHVASEEFARAKEARAVAYQERSRAADRVRMAKEELDYWTLGAKLEERWDMLG